VEQASCYIHVQHKFALRDARKGILCAICFILSSCSTHGIDAVWQLSFLWADISFTYFTLNSLHLWLI
jgi:hypothetical protein